MIKLLKKEISLSMHPTAPLMLLLSAMVFIPNYPYSVIFFYVSMSVFFTCLLGRENNDILFMQLLPVSKRSAVKGRFIFTVLLELLQLILTAICIFIKSSFFFTQNQAGFNADTALIGIGFIIYGVFNLVFFISYYGDTDKVGISFIKACAAMFICTAAEIICRFAVPFARDVLNTQLPGVTLPKFLFVVVCTAVFALLTFISYKKSVHLLENSDIH